MPFIRNSALMIFMVNFLIARAGSELMLVQLSQRMRMPPRDNSSLATDQDSITPTPTFPMEMFNIDSGVPTSSLMTLPLTTVPTSCDTWCPKHTAATENKCSWPSCAACLFCGQARYWVNRAEGVICEIGAHVTTKDACKAAAASLSKQWYPDESFSKGVPGCFEGFIGSPPQPNGNIIWNSVGSFGSGQHGYAVCDQARAADYARGPLGSNACPDGYTFIDSQEECKIAAAANGKSATLGSIENSEHRPKGCFYSDLDCCIGIYSFNTHVAGGNTHSKRGAICTKAPYILSPEYSNECPDGYSHIAVGQCKTAAAALGGIFTSTNNHEYRPAGCYWRMSDGNVYANMHSVGSGYAGTQAVCGKDSMSPTPMKPTPALVPQTPVPPTSVPPTSAPPTPVPPTSVSPTHVPPTPTLVHPTLTLPAGTIDAIPYSVMSASQSSTKSHAVAANCLTSSPSNSWPGTCTHTDKSHGSWWKVSLAGRWAVRAVTLTNRANCCSDRLQNIDVYVDGSKCASNVNVTGGATEEIACSGTGSEIKVQHRSAKYLTICGFGAYGSEAQDLHEPSEEEGNQLRNQITERRAAQSGTAEEDEATCEDDSTFRFNGHACPEVRRQLTQHGVTCSEIVSTGLSQKEQDTIIKGCPATCDMCKQLLVSPLRHHRQGPTRRRRSATCAGYACPAGYVNRNTDSTLLHQSHCCEVVQPYAQYSAGKLCMGKLLYDGKYANCKFRCASTAGCMFYTTYDNDWCQISISCAEQRIADDPSAVTYQKNTEACNVNSDCTGGRVCGNSGYCILPILLENKCESWCNYHTAPWQDRCAWPSKSCSVCAQCKAGTIDTIPYSVMNASQSSTIKKGEASKCLTLLPSNNWPGSCTHTDEAQGSWWKVSLSGRWTIRAVKLTNRAGCCSDRLQKVDIYVGESKCASNVHVGGGATEEIACSGTGSEIKVQQKHTNYLTICGFVAYGAETLV